MTPTIIIDVSEIDLLLDSGLDPIHLDGQLLRWHDGGNYPLLLVRGQPRASLTVVCDRCRKSTIDLLVGPGLHNGAWCYVFDGRGNYIANLRDDVWVCGECRDLKHPGPLSVKG